MSLEQIKGRIDTSLSRDESACVLAELAADLMCLHGYLRRNAGDDETKTTVMLIISGLTAQMLQARECYLAGTSPSGELYTKEMLNIVLAAVDVAITIVPNDE